MERQDPGMERAQQNLIGVEEESAPEELSVESYSPETGRAVLNKASVAKILESAGPERVEQIQHILSARRKRGEPTAGRVLKLDRSATLYFDGKDGFFVRGKASGIAHALESAGIPIPDEITRAIEDHDTPPVYYKLIENVSSDGRSADLSHEGLLALLGSDKMLSEWLNDLERTGQLEEYKRERGELTFMGRYFYIGENIGSGAKLRVRPDGTFHLDSYSSEELKETLDRIGLQSKLVKEVDEGYQNITLTDKGYETLLDYYRAYNETHNRGGADPGREIENNIRGGHHELFVLDGGDDKLIGHGASKLYQREDGSFSIHGYSADHRDVKHVVRDLVNFYDRKRKEKNKKSA